MRSEFNRKSKNNRRVNKKLLIIGLFAILITVSSIGTINSLAKEEVTSYKYYKSVIIEPDDTLWGYASEYACGYENTDKYIEEVKYINHMTDDEIHAGNSLVIPYYSNVEL